MNSEKKRIVAYLINNAEKFSVALGKFNILIALNGKESSLSKDKETFQLFSCSYHSFIKQKDLLKTKTKKHALLSRHLFLEKIKTEIATVTKLLYL